MAGVLADVRRRPQLRGRGSGSFFFAPDGETIFACINGYSGPQIRRFWLDGRVRDATNGIAAPTKRVQLGVIDLSLDKKLIGVTSPEQGLAYVIDIDDLSKMRAFVCPRGVPCSLAFIEEDTMLAVGTDTGGIAVLRLDSGKPARAPLTQGTDKVTSMSYSPGRSLLVAGDANGALKAWNTKTFQEISIPKKHQAKIYSTAFSPNGRWLVTVGGTNRQESNQAGEIRIWDASTTAMDLKLRFTAHLGCVTCVRFSPDGETFATTGRDGKLLFWDVQELLEFAASQD